MSSKVRRMKRGKIAMAISTRDGGAYPHNEMVQDPVNGQWVHYTEVDEDSINWDWVGRPIIDDISIDHPLPPTHIGPTLRNPYKYGNFHLNIHFNPPELKFSSAFQFPERTFYLMTDTSNRPPQPDLAHSEAIEERDREVQFNVPDFKNDENSYVYFYIHRSRSKFSSFDIDRPNNVRFDQSGIWESAGWVRFNESGEEYNIWRTEQRLIEALLFGSDGAATMYFGV